MILSSFAYNRLSVTFSILLILSSFSINAQNCLFDYDVSLKISGCIENNGEIIVNNITGGTPPYRYQLNNKSSLSAHFEDLKMGEYTLKIKDANNCTEDTLIKLKPDLTKKLFHAPNAFSPNNDGINDTWGIGGVERYKGVRVSIFNKWGQQLYENEDFTNVFPWDGTQNGDPLPEGTYYYVISVSVECREINEKGTITIAR